LLKTNQRKLEPDKRIVRLLDSSSVWRDDVFGYIRGYIVKQLIPTIKCVECFDALVAERSKYSTSTDIIVRLPVQDINLLKQKLGQSI
jgi:hypothetical protein